MTTTDTILTRRLHGDDTVRTRRLHGAEPICGERLHGAEAVRTRRLREADNWLRGKSSLTKTDVVLLILAEAERDMRSLSRRYADFAFGVVGRWVDELIRYGTFQNTSLDESYRRLQYLLDADLLAYLGSYEDQHRLKAEWAEEYTVAQPSTLPPSALLSYIPFAAAAARL